MRSHTLLFSIPTILTAFALLAGGCSKPPNSGAASESSDKHEVSPTPRIEAEAFHGQVYKSLNGITVLTLISKDECELAEGSTTLLCKYTKQDDKLRIVTTALGTSQVVYFRVTDEGLQANDGNVLLSPARYTAALEQRRKAQEEQKRAEIQKQQEEEAKRLKEQHRQEAIASSKVETQAVGTFKHTGAACLVENVNYVDLLRSWSADYKQWGTVTLTDVSLKVLTMQSRGETQNEVIYFSDVSKIGDVEKNPNGIGFVVAYGWENRDRGEKGVYREVFTLGSPAEATKAHDALVQDYATWKSKFPEAVYQ